MHTKTWEREILTGFVEYLLQWCIQAGNGKKFRIKQGRPG
jgi:hypothetical protein